MRANINLYNTDCLPAMRKMADNQYDLCICDPPYFKGPERRGYYGSKFSSRGVKRIDYPKTDSWDIPNDNYFKELKRVSKNQIIWGINYFNFKNTGSGRIIWDKVNGYSSFSDCEISYCSMHNSVRLFRYMWNGMMQGKSMTKGYIMQGDKTKNEKRIHVTQKPVVLYKWLLKNYAKPGDKILDTYFGSLSIGIACWDYGYDLDAYEIDRNYFEAGKKRLEIHKSQLKLYK